MANRCEDCRWWDSSIQHGAAEPDTTGICRVNPPVADERDARARWPFTEDTDWCGSFVKAEPRPSCQ
jgi:hypothetical protein